MPNRTVGSVKLSIGPEDDFIWIDSTNGKPVKGIWRIEKETIILTSDNDKETVRVRFSAGNNRLILKTDDGFTFVFIKI